MALKKGRWHDNNDLLSLDPHDLEPNDILLLSGFPQHEKDKNDLLRIGFHVTQSQMPMDPEMGISIISCEVNSAR